MKLQKVELIRKGDPVTSEEARIAVFDYLNSDGSDPVLRKRSRAGLRVLKHKESSRRGQLNVPKRLNGKNR